MKPQKQHLGFTLAEMAVVLLIVGILLAGAFIPLSTQLEVRNTADTLRTMEQIKEAIIGFTQINGRLPCPATANLPTSNVNAGLEQRAAGACTATSGVTPWATLGVSEVDAWGNRFSYWVVSVFGDDISQTTTNGPTQTGTSAATCGYAFLSPQPTQSSFALCTAGNLTVQDRGSDHTAITRAQNLPVIIISHGKNGYGAWRPDGTRAAIGTADVNGDAVPDTNIDESSNAAAGGTMFMYRNRTASENNCSDTINGRPFCEFDDIVTWITSNLLVFKMVSAGKLP